ncbi:MAG: hypothetical protein IT548_14950 [Alphaproteobacteria bacterium]|nr:hypothetical protein [Alphaproteobacteria bacterium]
MSFLERMAERQKPGRVENEIADQRFKAVMASIKGGYTPSRYDLSQLTPAQRWDYESARRQHEDRKHAEAKKKKRSPLEVATALGELSATNRMMRERSLTVGSGFSEAMRLQAWFKHARHQLRLNEDGTDVLMPDGWPEGVDPEEYATAEYDALLERAEFDAWKSRRGD